MFGKSKPPESDGPRRPAVEASRGQPHSGTPAAQTPEPTRRSGSYALPGTRLGDQRTAAARPAGPERRLVVGREISLSGEIKACEHLVVEGKVKADLNDCKLLQISVSGLYRGAATVDQADISGHFDGELTVRGTLILRSTGRVSGTLRYGEMEIERGGKVSGSLQDIPPAEKAAEKAARAGAAPGKAPAPRAPAAGQKAAPKATLPPKAPAAADASKGDGPADRAQTGGEPAT